MFSYPRNFYWRFFWKLKKKCSCIPCHKSNDFVEEKKEMKKIMLKEFGQFKIGIKNKSAFCVLVRGRERQNYLLSVSKTQDPKHKTVKNFKKYHLAL